MMSKYKMLVVDIDGTLADKNGDIADIDIKAIKEAVVRGIRVSLSTGRAVDATRYIIDRLGLDGFHILFDGALVMETHRNIELYSRPIKPDMVRRAVEFCRRHDIYLELYSSTTLFTERKNWSDAMERQFFHLDPKMTDFSGIWERERIIKAELLVHDETERKKYELFKREFDGCFRFSIARSPGFPGLDFINIVDPGVSKGEAMKELANYMGVSVAEVIAIGDGLNDIPLLEAAGLPVAMGNAFPEVKKIAAYITLDVDHGGVAAAIKKFLL